ncbi:PREDICTED: photosynthetic NDH subunit of subcomplex B 3, chloroplastic [Tarenaya hassleriana]|uniref:photosynthetic NDH subunit of subcomplex B 3, chloroplastic n=1 Tax=Tarenaya hassleriana TaxID=28532 RepID=UPI00053C773A|nr:PREDICTED: photosynthetic NDH subunit of subcomplex B 3, chloroplastic [Tarenaya hassleriana]
MGSAQMNASGLVAASLPPNHKFAHKTKSLRLSKHNNAVRFCRADNAIRAVGTVPANQSPATVDDDEPPSVDFAFVHSVLLPDGTPDVHMRRACGGQKLRDIMLDSNVELYGPYAKPLSNCGGVGTCGTCMVEVVDGKELLSPRTDIEKEKLKRKPKTWRLACQTAVGESDSNGLVVIQQLPEWKAHEWKMNKDLAYNPED